jgi:hypothetical protein
MAVEKYKYGPSAKEMKDFSKRFSKEEWEKLYANQKFLDVFSSNIDACRLLAEKILAGKKI